MKGNPPNRNVTKKLAADLGLKANQIYKWFWDTKKKIDEDAQLAC